MGSFLDSAFQCSKNYKNDKYRDRANSFTATRVMQQNKQKLNSIV